MEAIIFDFDGTVVDTEWPETVAWQQIYDEFGIEMDPNAWMKTIGRGADQEAERPADDLAAKLGDPSRAPELADMHRARRISIIESQPILPGVVELIDEAQAAGLRLALASSSEHAWVEGHLQRLGLHDRFEFFACREDVPMTKPSPALYELALRHLGMAPSQACAIEDSPSGLAAAQAAGLYTIVVPNKLTAQLDLSPADWLVDSLAEVNLEAIKLRIASRPN